MGDLGVPEEALRCVCVQQDLCPLRHHTLPSQVSQPSVSRGVGFGVPHSSVLSPRGVPGPSATLLTQFPRWDITESATLFTLPTSTCQSTGCRSLSEGCLRRGRRMGCTCRGSARKRGPGAVPLLSYRSGGPGPDWGAGGGTKAHVLAARLLTRPCIPAGMAAARAR